MSPVHSDIWKPQVFVIVTDVHRVLSPTAKERYKGNRHSPSNHREKCLRERHSPVERENCCDHLRMAA